jgi:glucose-6-phosphate 1-dehydrogenase
VSVETVNAPVGVSAATAPEDHVIVLFGATGDLARRKLLPGVFHLAAAGLMPERFVLIGASRSMLEDEEFVEMARVAVEGSGRRPAMDGSWDRFAASLRFAGLEDGYETLGAAVARAREELGGEPRLLHYLSLPPMAAAGTVEALGRLGLGDGARVIMEKPFGVDLASARALDARVHSVFDESRVFRIDHYLGREAVQNLLAVRFANGMFEPVWNRNHIDHVQIDIPETLGLDRRAAFYEQTGAFKDMVVTHLLQVLAFVAMEPPTALEPRAISEEKNKVFRSLMPIHPNDVVRGQYSGYTQEEGVPIDSDTETFIALKCGIDNWRWAGVPFYLRTGKKMAEGQRIISIAFKEAPKSMFPSDSGVGKQGPDHLTFDLSEDSKVSLSFYGKRPGPGMKMDKLSMQFATQEGEHYGDVLEAYERLILDTMRGDHTLFTTADGIESLWERAQPLLDDPPPAKPYAPGSWGPNAVHQLIAPHAWRLPFERAWRAKK